MHAYHTNGALYGTKGVLITQIKVYAIGILQCTHCLSLYYKSPAKKAFYFVAAAAAASKCLALFLVQKLE